MARQCPPGTVAYTIKTGDTLYKLAQTYKTTVPAITAANPNLNPNALRVGQIICIPSPSGSTSCPGGSSYTIKSGDTFVKIAAANNISVDQLRKANPGVDPNRLQIGQTICVPKGERPTPGPSPTPGPGACPTGTTPYMVKAGDNFYALAQRFNTTVDAITKANPGVNPNALRIGERICIPGSSAPPPGPKVCPSGTFTYTVKAGDTVYALANRYNTTVDAIGRSNPGVNLNIIQIGQSICIPGAGTPRPQPQPQPPSQPGVCPTGYFSHTIQSGDTLAALARQYRTTVEAIMTANPGLNPNDLQVARIICIPGRSETLELTDQTEAVETDAATAFTQGNPADPVEEATCPTGTFTYVVISGDTLYVLAQRYKTTVEAISRANPGINPNALQIGQRICIPGTAPQPPQPGACPSGTFAYSVKAGDTLYALAARNNTTVDAIVRANPGINPNALQIGQRICIPGTAPQPPQPGVCPSGTSVYAIKSGDTLFGLAQRYNTSVDAILRANPGLDPNRLYIGQQICIPGQPPAQQCPDGATAYTIKTGDTLFAIAERYNTTVDAILQINPGVDPSRLQIGQLICIPSQKLIYANRQYQVVFLYPNNWQRVTNERYEGPNGFFQVSAAGTGTATRDEVCRNEAFQALRPYGSNPGISRTTVDGQEACYIEPASDQPAAMRQQAAFIVRYPKPVTINGQNYNFFVLWADKAHIRDLAATLEFLP